MAAQAGDVGWVEQQDFTSWWIRFAQHRKYGKDASEAQWNHVFMVSGAQGEIIEADPSGVSAGNLSEYSGATVTLRRPAYTGAAPFTAVAAMRKLQGDKYGFLTIASVALSMLTGTKLRFGLSGTEICSGAVSYALTRANIDMGLDCEFNTPADVMHIAIAQQWKTVTL